MGPLAAPGPTAPTACHFLTSHETKGPERRLDRNQNCRHPRPGRHPPASPGPSSQCDRRRGGQRGEGVAQEEPLLSTCVSYYVRRRGGGGRELNEDSSCPQGARVEAHEGAHELGQEDRQEAGQQRTKCQPGAWRRAGPWPGAREATRKGEGVPQASTGLWVSKEGGLGCLTPKRGLVIGQCGPRGLDAVWG